MDTVYFQRNRKGKACFKGFQHICEFVPSGEGEKALGVEGVEAEVHSGNSYLLHPLQVTAGFDPVGGNVKFRYLQLLLQDLHEINKTPADERLSSGQSHLYHAKSKKQPDNSLHFLVAERLLVTDRLYSLLGHAVPAAQIASVGDGQSKVGNLPSVIVDDWRETPAVFGNGWVCFTGFVHWSFRNICFGPYG